MNKNITATILIVLAVGVYFTFTQAKWDEVNAVRAVNDQYSQAIQNSDNLIKVRDKVLKDYNSLSVSDRDRLNKMVPNTTDNIRLIIDLSGVAGRRGLSLRNVQAAAAGALSGQGSQKAVQTSPSPPPVNNAVSNSLSGPVLDTVKVSFSVSAPYRQFIQFLRDLEADLRIMDLTHLTVAANDTGTYDFSVELATYWLRQQ
jgi:Tfp pilus assembly protein PilO